MKFALISSVNAQASAELQKRVKSDLKKELLYKLSDFIFESDEIIAVSGKVVSSFPCFPKFGIQFIGELDVQFVEKRDHYVMYAPQKDYVSPCGACAEPFPSNKPHTCGHRPTDSPYLSSSPSHNFYKAVSTFFDELGKL